MIPLPDWSRLRPRALPPSAARSGGCSDFSGCLLGCGGTLIVMVLSLNVAKRYGIWAGLAALAILILIANRLNKLSMTLVGVLLGALTAMGVWTFMAQDYSQHPEWRITNSLLAFGLLSLAGYWEQKRRS